MTTVMAKTMATATPMVIATSKAVAMAVATAVPVAVAFAHAAHSVHMKYSWTKILTCFAKAAHHCQRLFLVSSGSCGLNLQMVVVAGDRVFRTIFAYCASRLAGSSGGSVLLSCV